MRSVIDGPSDEALRIADLTSFTHLSPVPRTPAIR